MCSLKIRRQEHRPDKFYDTFKPYISNKGKRSIAIHLKTEENNVEKDQNEVAEMLANYFTNAAFNIGDHVSSLTKESHSEHDSQLGAYESIQRKFDFKLVTVVELQQHLKRSTQRNLVDGTPGSHQNFEECGF